MLQTPCALGFGPVMQQWLETLYNPCSPHERAIKVNGTVSEYFPLGSGVPQGCPASPLYFLLIAEGLTRLINSDPEIEGIAIRTPHQAQHGLPATIHKLTQFADDSLFYLRNFLSHPPTGGMYLYTKKPQLAEQI